MTTLVKPRRYGGVVIFVDLLKIFLERQIGTNKQQAYSVTYLAKRLNVHPRTIYRMFDVMRRVGIAPHSYVSRRRTFYWLPADKVTQLLCLPK